MRHHPAAILALAVLTGGLVGCLGDIGGGDEHGPQYKPNGAGSGYSALSINGGAGSITADINIKLRGWAEVDQPRTLVDVNGPTDAAAPKLNTLFADRRVPAISNVFQVGVFAGVAHGVEGQWPVHLVRFVTHQGEQLRLPESGYSIGDGRMALVLYADNDSITLKYSREDSIVTGYTIHLVGVSVAPALRSLYDSCHAAGRSELPALAAGQPIGTAHGSLLVSIRDTGQFMDPRARKDWYDGTGPVEPPASQPPPSQPPPSQPPANEPPPSQPPANEPPANEPPPSQPPANEPPPSQPPASQPPASQPGACACTSGVDNFCHYLPNTAGCSMTAPGGYCDPNGDGSYDDADWVRGFNEYKAQCAQTPAPPPPASQPPASQPGACACTSGVDNFCHYLPNTADCPMTAPGGYCDPNGDGSYDDADWVRGFNEYKAQCP